MGSTVYQQRARNLTLSKRTWRQPPPCLVDRVPGGCTLSGCFPSLQAQGGFVQFPVLCLFFCPAICQCVSLGGWYTRSRVLIGLVACFGQWNIGGHGRRLDQRGACLLCSCLPLLGEDPLPLCPRGRETQGRPDPRCSRLPSTQPADTWARHTCLRGGC